MKAESFKFRTYDSILKKFIFFDLCNVSGHLPNDCRDNVNFFSGLLDKNGNEIYDGDYLHTPSGKVPVIFNGKEFKMNYGSINYHTNNMTSYEICGNIYE